MYNRLFKQVLFPLYEGRIRGRKTAQYLQRLNQNQWKSTEELRAIQWRHLKSLLEHAYQYSPYYKELFQQHGIHPDTINSAQDYLKVPVCTREAIVKNKSQMLATNFADKVTHKTTGGSTGVPVQFALDRNSYEWRVAATQRGYQWAGCEAGQHVVYLWGVDVGEPTYLNQIKTSLYHKAFNRKMFNCFNFTEDEMRRCLSYINNKRPNGIVSFTTAVYNFAKFIDSNNLKCVTVPAIITGAEKLYPHQRALLERVFGGKVFNTYGCREFMLIAAECDKHEGLHTTLENLYVEILVDGEPAKPGERGEIVITDLHNYGMPFIRYKNGDVAVQGDRSCSCGRGLPLITDIDGRKMDEITATDGKAVSGGYFPHLMKEFEEIAKFQVVQTATNSLIIKLVLKSQIPVEKMEFCRQEIHKVLGQDMMMEFQEVDDIPLTSSGKYRVTISEIAQP